MLRNLREFKRQKKQIFDVVYLESDKHFEKHYWGIKVESWSEQYAILIFPLKPPVEEIRGRPLKSFSLTSWKQLRISEHMLNRKF